MKKIIFTICTSLIMLSNSIAQTKPQIKITVGSNVFIVNTYDNPSAKAFMELLPLTIQMNELNGNEKYYYLSSNLPSDASNPGTIQSGDLMLWGSNCLVLFYETFTTSYSYTKIGTIENSNGLKQILGTANPTVKFELLQATDLRNSTAKELPFFDFRSGTISLRDIAKKVSLIDMTGRVIVSATNCQQLNVQYVKAGLYILRVSKDNSVRDVRIIL